MTSTSQLWNSSTGFRRFDENIGGVRSAMRINVTRRHMVLELEGFATEEACWNYLPKLRWPKGFVCPRCVGDGRWAISVPKVKDVYVVMRPRHTENGAVIFDLYHNKQQHQKEVLEWHKIRRNRRRFVLGEDQLMLFTTR